MQPDKPKAHHQERVRDPDWSARNSANSNQSQPREQVCPFANLSQQVLFRSDVRIGKSGVLGLHELGRTWRMKVDKKGVAERFVLLGPAPWNATGPVWVQSVSMNERGSRDD